MIKTETRERIATIELACLDKKNALTEAMSAFIEKRKPDFSRF